MLVDSWYPSKELIEAHLRQEFYVIAVLKTNLIIHPKGITIQTKEFVQYIETSNINLVVTVEEKTYRVYRYEEALKDLDDAVVLLVWKADESMTMENLYCVLSTDPELIDVDILKYDTKRWSMECFFRQAKNTL
jgi:hypothetical protein